jgi:hypothetical protein
MSMGNTAFAVPMQPFYGRQTAESPVARMAAGPLNGMGQCRHGVGGRTQQLGEPDRPRRPILEVLENRT